MRYWIMGILAGLSTGLCAQTTLETAISNLSKDPVLQQGGLGIAVVQATTGKMVASYQPDLLLTPASVVKVLTTAMALDVLGADYRFKTELLYDGAIDSKGTLTGNIYIKGYGDPTLGSPEWNTLEQLPPVTTADGIVNDWVQAIRKKGIRRVEGHIVGDATYFEPDMPAPTWQWNDIGNYYGSGASGLNFHDNLYYADFKLSPSAAQSPTLLGTHPFIPYLSLDNQLTTGAKGSGDNAYIFGSPYTYNRYVEGTLPLGSGTMTIKGSIPDPAYFAAFQLMEGLRKAGIVTTQAATTQLEQLRAANTSSAPTHLLHTHYSPPLSDIVTRTNVESVNLYAECMMKAMAVRLRGAGTNDYGVQEITNYWRNRGVDVDGMTLYDGCGLSPRNVLSSSQMVQIMRKIAIDTKISTAFTQSLAVAGQSGTLKTLLKGSKAEGNLRGKSGSMTGVRSYTGYVKTRSGSPMVFCLIANNFACTGAQARQKLEVVMKAIADLP
jgi:D-alanyl-D-alanine carboxypeptidase/D-alanyl-D-alanine-endopeptidase (penicillin-binding protein 4)